MSEICEICERPVLPGEHKSEACWRGVMRYHTYDCYKLGYERLKVLAADWQTAAKDVIGRDADDMTPAEARQRITEIAQAEGAERLARDVERDALKARVSQLRAALRGLESCVSWSDSMGCWVLAGNERMRTVLAVARAVLSVEGDEP